MGHQMKETSGNWVTATNRFAPLQTMGMVGATDSESEEAEEAEQIDNSLDARLERAAAEPDYEREEIFRYLKEFRRQKRLKQGIERQDRAREEMHCHRSSENAVF